MPFQLHDYVRVKPGVLLLETNEPVPGWEGEITELPIHDDDTSYLVALDAISLHQLPEKYLADCISEGDLATAYYFEEQDLEPAVRRDTDEQRAAALARLEPLFDSPEDELDNNKVEAWIHEFAQSPQYATLTPEEQESAKFIVDMFAEYAFNYRGDQPMDWTIETLREVCLELLPRKFTAKIEDFEEAGVVLRLFFAFLDEKKYLKDAGRLQKEMQKIAPKMVANAKDPHNWGMAKSFAMDALDADIDMGDVDAMNDFMANYSAKILQKMDFPDVAASKQSPMRPARENPFKNISRNQTIKVTYPDGSIREGKFKRLEEELRAGKCSLVS
jgi:hypothetical protein